MEVGIFFCLTSPARALTCRTFSIPPLPLLTSSNGLGDKGERRGGSAAVVNPLFTHWKGGEGGTANEASAKMTTTTTTILSTPAAASLAAEETRRRRRRMGMEASPSSPPRLCETTTTYKRPLWTLQGQAVEEWDTRRQCSCPEKNKGTCRPPRDHSI